MINFAIIGCDRKGECSKYIRGFFINGQIMKSTLHWSKCSIQFIKIRKVLKYFLWFYLTWFLFLSTWVDSCNRILFHFYLVDFLEIFHTYFLRFYNISSTKWFNREKYIFTLKNIMKTFTRNLKAYKIVNKSKRIFWIKRRKILEYKALVVIQRISHDISWKLK